MSNKQETIADIVAEMRLGVKDWKGERLGVFDCFADRIEAAHKREREAGAEAAQICGEIGEMIGRESHCKEVTNCNRLGNAAKIRDALSDACYAMFNLLKTQNGGYEEMAKALDKAKAALAEPPRNCDRLECATTKAAQDVWRKEDGGKTAYYEWLLAADLRRLKIAEDARPVPASTNICDKANLVIREFEKAATRRPDGLTVIDCECSRLECAVEELKEALGETSCEGKR